jgi:hypothetical protein
MKKLSSIKDGRKSLHFNEDAAALWKKLFGDRERLYFNEEAGTG